MSFKFTDEDIARAGAIMRNAKFAKQMSQQAEYKRILKSRQRVNRIKKNNATNGALGEYIGTIPFEEFIVIRHKEGQEAFNDDGFVDWMKHRVLKPEGLA